MKFKIHQKLKNYLITKCCHEIEVKRYAIDFKQNFQDKFFS